MTDLRLEPYAARLDFRLEAAAPIEQWKTTLAGYMQALARRCEESGPCVIGHIKALALFTDGCYLRISVVSASHPAQFDGNPPLSFKELHLTLNVLVYGLPREVLQQIVAQTASDLGPALNGHVAATSVGFDILH